MFIGFRFVFRISPLAVLLGLSLSNAAGAMEVYRWTDAQGHTHFADRRPAGTNRVRKHIVPRRVNDAEEADTLLARTLAQIERQIEALRDLRAAKLGISRAALDRREGVGLASDAQTESRTRPRETDAATDPGYSSPESFRTLDESPRYISPGGDYAYGAGYGRGLRSETSDAFRPRRHYRAKGFRPGNGAGHYPRHRYRPRARRRSGQCCGPATGG